MKKYCSICKKELGRHAQYQEGKYCKQCYLKNIAKIIVKGKFHPNFKTGKPKCIDCNKELNNYNAKRCWKCYVKWSQIPENNANFKIGETLKKHFCECGKEIQDYKAIRCRECADKYHSIQMEGNNNPMYDIHLTGKLNHNWIDGRSYLPYTIEFTDELKESIRQRDNHICQNCGMTEEEHLIVNGQILHVHHIDYNKQNCKENNLITLCLSCNVKANYNRTYWQEFYTNLIRNKINRGVDVVLYQNNVNNKGNSKKNLYASLLN